ncbi:MAG: alpha/beta hydrolase [Chitinophagaceae bacterium]
MRSLAVFILACIFSLQSISQTNSLTDSVKHKYQGELRTIARSFSNYFYPNRDVLYGLAEKNFVIKVDSLRKTFMNVLDQYKMNPKADHAFVKKEQEEIHYFFDKLILDYPYFHELASNTKTKLSAPTQKRLDANLRDFNNPALLTNPDFKEYVRGFMHHHTQDELKKPAYKIMDNQRLNSILAIIPKYITNAACRNFWKYDYIYGHIDDWGVKNIASILAAFNASCKDTSYINTLNAMYADGMRSRADHLIKTYKTVDGFPLDIHLFLPGKSSATTKYPAMVYFSGGSWTKGSPEWAFGNCTDYAKKGWVGVSVEYRLADRHGTTAFDAVKDARTAIRWLRQHASEYNIDTNRIVASGNSAGGHLVLSAALSDQWNEKTDDLRYSASPNLLLVYSGVYDMIGDGNTSWISKDLKDKNEVKKISPLHLIREGLPPMLLFHGTNDHSVAFETAKSFEEAMKKTNNDFEFHSLEGASHEIWFERRFYSSIDQWRNDFLKKHGYE